MIHIFDLDDTLLMSNTYNKYLDIYPNELLNKIMRTIKKKYIFSNGTDGHVDIALYYMKMPKPRYIFSRYNKPGMKPDYGSYLYVHNYIYNNPENLYEQIIFYDDLLNNLYIAKRFGWKTVWITDSKDIKPSYVDYKFNNITDALLDI